MELIRNRHFMMAHRHKISLIDADYGNYTDNIDRPRPAWLPRLNGQLFTPIEGYDGPGISAGNGVYSIGTYGSWYWKNEGELGMWAHSNAWVDWFNVNAPSTEYFLYLIDESSDYAQIEQWASFLDTNEGSGKALMSMATI